MSTNFYSELPSLLSFDEITNPEVYHLVPDSWYVVLSDVIGSRNAIKEGKYKEVNTIGASCIVATINVLDTLEVPYVFGGDGASICIPPEFLDAAKNAFLGTKNMAKVAFSLDLRIGAIPVKSIRSQGGELLVAKVKLSEVYQQAVFTGGGLALADKLLKEKNSKYLIKSENQMIAADFTGLECRWDRVSQDGKLVISMLIKCTSSALNSVKEYRKIINNIEQIVSSEHPITEKSLKFSFNPRWLKNEIKTRTFTKSTFDRLLYIIDLYYRIVIGKILMAFNIKTNDFEWGNYKNELIMNSDYKKFDDMLRVVLSCTQEEKEALVGYLDELETEQSFRYGIHISEAALVTCMIKEYSGMHFHFVDGDDGGYAMAAIDMASKSV
ncbi:MAG: DUF3095 domain-containing protein [Balneolaceae bacterium]|nr:DUF3095 domain-containing protein [Balneolaceae bacterium]